MNALLVQPTEAQTTRLLYTLAFLVNVVLFPFLSQCKDFMIRIILSGLVELNSEPGSPSNLKANSFELYCIVRPGNGRWACQKEHCHSLSI